MRVPSGHFSSENLCHWSFLVVLAVLGVEFVELPNGLSLFKVVIVPLSLVGALSLLLSGIRVSVIPGFLPFLGLFFFLLLPFFRWGNGGSLNAALGVLPFFFFIYFYIVTFGWRFKATVALSFWSVPHLISLILYFLGLSNSAYSDSEFRFDGIQADPNFMVVFVLASLSGKIQLYRRPRWTIPKWLILVWIVIDVVMIALSGSRGGIIAFVVMLAVSMVMKFGYLRTFGFLLLGWVAFLGFVDLVYATLPETVLSAPVWITLDRVLSTNAINLNASSGDRLYLWEKAGDLVRERGVWVGYTVENFRKKYWKYPHNTYVDAALETGVPGLVTLCIMIGFSVVVLAGNRKSLDEGGVLALLICISFSIALVFLSSFSTKVFWFSVVFPYASSLRILRTPSGSVN